MKKQNTITSIIQNHQKIIEVNELEYIISNEEMNFILRNFDYLIGNNISIKSDNYKFNYNCYESIKNYIIGTDLNLEDCIEITKNITGISYETIKSNLRYREIVFARLIYYILSKTLTNYSLYEISIKINRNHSTVISAFKNHLSWNPTYKTIIETLKEYVSEKDIKNLRIKYSNNIIPIIK